MKKEKVLIFKLGYTEILDKEQDGRVVSLGDVLRTTSLLHKYKDNQVTWVTSEKAYDLLNNNKYIDRLLVLDPINICQLQAEEFDKIINLEKVPGICALSDSIRARRSKYGFTFDTQTGQAIALDKAYDVLAVSFKPKHKKNNKRTFQELLFEMVEEKFNKEEYILGHKPKTKEIYDIGFNVKVGEKWPSKAWPIKNWDKLENLLKKDFSLSRQDKQKEKILNNLHSYIDWINSCKTLISNDSLGLHMALALKKKVIGLFGPTSPNEIYFYNRGKAICSDNLNCKESPCFKPFCKKYNPSCINLITAEKVAEEMRLLKLD